MSVLSFAFLNDGEFPVCVYVCECVYVCIFFKHPSDLDPSHAYEIYDRAYFSLNLSETLLEKIM